MAKNIIRSSRAFTLLELLITVAIVGLLSAIALPSYQEYRDRVDIGLAIADLQLIDQKFEVYYSTYDSYPPNLAAAGLATMLDPWATPTSTCASMRAPAREKSARISSSTR